MELVVTYRQEGITPKLFLPHNFPIHLEIPIYSREKYKEKYRN